MRNKSEKIMKKISFIVPVYNVEKYLAECINSILNVEYQNKEIILINDGSTDDSEKICRIYEQDNENIKLISKKNEGLSEARNLGIRKATGEYIFFIDSDDFYSYDFSRDISTVINENSYDVILFDYKYYNQQSDTFLTPKKTIDKNNINGKEGIQVLEYFLEYQKNIQWIVVQGVYKKEFLVGNELYFVKDRYYEDILWLPEVFINSNSMFYIDNNIYVYRLEREGQITSDISEKSLSDNLYVIDYWEKKLRKYKLKEELKVKIMKNIITRYYYTIWYNHFLLKEERVKIQNEINKYKKYLEITNSMTTKITSIIIKKIGIKYTSYLFYVAIKVKRKIKYIAKKVI